jgi:prephenate dehydrogenase
MATKLTIVGLGEVGTAFGLALRSQTAQILRAAHDRSQAAAQRALNLGAVDETHTDLMRAIKGARIILLCLPLHEIQPLMARIGPDLSDGVLVMDTSPAKALVANWMREFLPQGCAYVGLLPALNLQSSPDDSSQVDNPLRQMPIFLAGLPGTPSAALETAADLIAMAEAQPVFTDIAELDGLTVGTFLLPALASAVLFDVTSSRPGWQEARRTTGRTFAALAMSGDLIPPESLHLGLFSNKEHVIRLLDEYRAALQVLRDQIDLAPASEEAAGLLSGLERAAEQIQHWRQGRLTNRWDANLLNLPEKQDILSRWLGIRKKPKIERAK